MKNLKTIILAIFFIFLSMNLFPGQPEDDETILLPSTYGWFINGDIYISVHAWIFEMEDDSILKKGFIELLENHFEKASADEKKNFEERVRYFLTDNKRGKEITINIMGEEFNLPKTSPNGHTASIVKIKNKAADKSLSEKGFKTLPGKNTVKTFTGNFQIIGEKGYSIISDIDDTIKISNVLNKDELTKNVFLREFLPVKGMPQLYKNFEKKGVVFHYVSGSPWQLYPALSSFIHDEQFPEGSFELKLFRVKDKSFIDFIAADQLSYKLSAIKTIIERFPQRKFILIGDSGEKDPEVYSEIASRYKDRIKYIFIRDVGLIDLNSPRRKSVIEKAGDVHMVIFKEADELKKFITQL